MMVWFLWLLAIALGWFFLFAIVMKIIDKIEERWK